MSSQTKRIAESNVLQASEIGEYVYCHRAWWLGRVLGVPHANRDALEAGVKGHCAHGSAVRRASRLRVAARVCLIIALLAGGLLALRLLSSL